MLYVGHVHTEHLMATNMMKVGMQPTQCDACRVLGIGGIREQ